LQPYQAPQNRFRPRLTANGELGNPSSALYRAFIDTDSLHSEINPLLLTRPQTSPPSQMTFDDNCALPAKTLRELRDRHRRPAEVEASNTLKT